MGYQFNPFTGKLSPVASTIRIQAEDVDNPGTYRKVQGQYDANGDFNLLTKTSTTSAVYYYIIESGTYHYLLEDGSGALLLN